MKVSNKTRFSIKNATYSILVNIVAIVVANIHTFGVEGRLTGLNPLPAFSSECIKATILFYLLY